MEPPSCCSLAEDIICAIISHVTCEAIARCVGATFVLLAFRQEETQAHPRWHPLAPVMGQPSWCEIEDNIQEHPLSCSPIMSYEAVALLRKTRIDFNHFLWLCTFRPRLSLWQILIMTFESFFGDTHSYFSTILREHTWKISIIVQRCSFQTYLSPWHAHIRTLLIFVEIHIRTPIAFAEYAHLHVNHSLRDAHSDLVHSVVKESRDCNKRTSQALQYKPACVKSLIRTPLWKYLIGLSMHARLLQGNASW